MATNWSLGLCDWGLPDRSKHINMAVLIKKNLNCGKVNPENEKISFMFEDIEQLFGTKRASCMILKTNKYPQTAHTHVYLYSLDTHPFSSHI